MFTAHVFPGQSGRNNEEVTLIRKADLENHNKDGGFWTVIDGRVYDIKDFQAQALSGSSILGEARCSALASRGPSPAGLSLSSGGLFLGNFLGSCWSVPLHRSQVALGHLPVRLPVSVPRSPASAPVLNSRWLSCHGAQGVGRIPDCPATVSVGGGPAVESALCSLAAQFAGEDPVVALEAALQFEDTRESMHAFCVGQYLEVRLAAGGGPLPERGQAARLSLWCGWTCFLSLTASPPPQPDQEVVTVPDLGSLSSPLMDTERNLGLLLGLHASYLALSTPLSPVEVECASKHTLAPTH